MIQDANDEPQYGERVPYVITRGEPGMKLVDRAVAPEELLHNRYDKVVRVRLLVPLTARNQQQAHRRRILHFKGAYSTLRANFQSDGSRREKLVPCDDEGSCRRQCRGCSYISGEG
jgi:DNA polymerase elongation subunit (family B)